MCEIDAAVKVNVETLFNDARCAMNNRLLPVLALAAECLLLFACGCRSPLRLPPPETHSYRSLLEWSQQSGMPGAVLLVRTPETNFLASIGWADKKRKILMRPDHAFRIGSVTKTFTGIVTAQLHTEGKLDTDAVMTNYDFGINVARRAENGATLSDAPFFFGHAGGTSGYLCFAWHEPEHDLTIAFFGSSSLVDVFHQRRNHEFQALMEKALFELTLKERTKGLNRTPTRRILCHRFTNSQKWPQPPDPMIPCAHER